MTTYPLLHPPVVQKGDGVAVLSPSSGAAATFPHVFDLGLRRMRDVLGLRPVEFPTTRADAASPQERAVDINAAFADESVTAVVAAIGGDDQIKVLPHLDAELIRSNPKPFFGYSDNTNLHHFLWGLGIVSYYGGSVLVQLARPGAMHPTTVEALRNAMFTRGGAVLAEPGESWDEEVAWTEPDVLDHEPVLQPSEAWRWHGPQRVAEGPSWGGCLEIVDFQLRTGRYLLPDSAYDGCVLMLETSEELPPADYVYRVLMCMGERGLLGRFTGVLVGRPKAWSFEQRNDAAAKREYVEQQRAAVLRALEEYHPGVPCVTGVDFGHTDPQLVLPHGGVVRLDPIRRQVTVTY